MPPHPPQEEEEVMPPPRRRQPSSPGQMKAVQSALRTPRSAEQAAENAAASVAEPQSSQRVWVQRAMSEEEP